MSNMSYCRFQNTSGDLRDCYNALEEAYENYMTESQFRAKLSEDERYAYDDLLKVARALIELQRNMED